MPTTETAGAKDDIDDLIRLVGLHPGVRVDLNNLEPAVSRVDPQECLPVVALHFDIGDNVQCCHQNDCLPVSFADWNRHEERRPDWFAVALDVCVDEAHTVAKLRWDIHRV